jgi:hypothetical protein
MLLTDSEELLRAGHVHGIWTGGSRDIVIGTGQICGGLEEPAGRPGQIQGAGVTSEIECGPGRHYFAGGQDFRRGPAGGQSESDLRQLPRCEATGAGTEIKLSCPTARSRAVPVGDVKNGARIPRLRAAVGQAQRGRAVRKCDGGVVVGRADGDLQRAERLGSGSGAPLTLAQSEQAGVDNGAVGVLKESPVGDVDVFYAQSTALQGVLECAGGGALQGEFLGDLI